MEFGFLFWLFGIGIFVASLQDLKRREVDNWMNLLLMISGFVFIFYRAIFEKNSEIVFLAGFALVVMFVLMNLFYYGRIFAGGDAKLLVAMTAFFVGANFSLTFMNISIFLLLLMISGSFYGLFYSSFLYFRNYKKVNSEIKRFHGNLWTKVFVFIGLIVMLLGFFDLVFLIFGGLLLVFPFLFVFAKGLEKVSMIREVSGKNLREGDWLVDDVRVKNKVIRADWEGLSLENIKLLKNKRKIKIKEGLPFVPAFLIAFILYILLKDWIVVFLTGIF